MTKNYIDPNAMGADFCWSFGNGDARACMLPRQDVRAVFVENGFDPALIEEMDAAEALMRARNVVSKTKHIKIIQMDRPDKDTPRAFGIYQVIPRDGESGDEIVCGARVRIDTATSAVCLPPADCDEIASCMDVGHSMVNIVAQLCDNVFNRDVSQALLAVGTEMRWLGRRRNKGGVYYLNRTSAERFARLLMALKRMTNNRHRDEQFIPHITEQFDRPLTVESWTGAARDHYEAKVAGLVSKLDILFTKGKMRESSMEGHRDECDALLKEAMSYKQFMRGQLNPLEDRLKKIQGAFSKALTEGNEAIESDLRDIERMIGKAPTRAPVVAVADSSGSMAASSLPKLSVSDFDITFADASNA